MHIDTRRQANSGRTQFFQLGILIAILLSPYFALSIWGSEMNLIGFFPDDAFYYLKTARNFSDFGFATFDGVNPTNGFHPLYFLLVAGLAFIIPAADFLNAVFLLHISMIWLAIFLLVARLHTLSLSARIFFSAIFSFPAPFIFVWLSAGMEAPLVVLSTVLLLNQWMTAAQFNFKHFRANIWLGAAMTVFILSRLDMILPLIPFVVWLLAIQFRPGRDSFITSLLSLSSLFVLPFIFGVSYLIFNLLTSGHLLPISAAVKQEFFVPFFVSWAASTGNGNPALAALAISPLLLSGFVLFWSALPKSRAEACHHGCAIALASVSIILFYFYLFAYASNFFRWYFAMPFAASTWIVAHWFTQRNLKLIKRERLMLLASIVLMSVVLASNVVFVKFVAFTLKSTSWHLLQISRKLNEVAQPCDVVAVYDAGVIGYFSIPRVVNLDGLANNYTYFNEYLRPANFLEYFDKEKVSIYLMRDHKAKNWDEILSGQYKFAYLITDSRLIFPQQDELFRYAIPGTFTVVAYRYSNTMNSQCKH